MLPEQAAQRLRKALSNMMHFRSHSGGCSLRTDPGSDTCTCGLADHAEWARKILQETREYAT